MMTMILSVFFPLTTIIQLKSIVLFLVNKILDLRMFLLMFCFCYFLLPL